jgi:hypothetical protein
LSKRLEEQKRLDKGTKRREPPQQHGLNRLEKKMLDIFLRRGRHEWSGKLYKVLAL